VSAVTSKKRLGRGSIRALAVASGAVAFALPWVAVKYAPTPAASTAAASGAPRVIVVPAGSSVVVAKGAKGIKIVKSSGTAPVTSSATATTTPTTVTGGSAPVVH
jgi:hypothetical protein